MTTLTYALASVVDENAHVKWDSHVFPGLDEVQDGGHRKPASRR